jgi:hypothetical protein
MHIQRHVHNDHAYRHAHNRSSSHSLSPRARARALSLVCVQQSVEENPIARLCRQTPSDAEEDAGNDAPSDTATKDDDRSSASKAPDAADAKDETREQIKVV